MSHRHVLALACAATVFSPAAVAQPGDAHGIHVQAACLRATPAPRLLVDLSCASAMDCWSDPAVMGVLDVETGRTVSSAANDLVYVDEAGRVLAEPPMQGTIRAVWTLGLTEAGTPRRLQLVQGNATATAAFEPAADCKALPKAAVERLAGG